MRTPQTTLTSSPGTTPGDRQVILRRDTRGIWSISTDELLGADNRLGIVHQGESYQLRVTRQYKLILTK